MNNKSLSRSDNDASVHRRKAHDRLGVVWQSIDVVAASQSAEEGEMYLLRALENTLGALKAAIQAESVRGARRPDPRPPEQLAGRGGAISRWTTSRPSQAKSYGLASPTS